jgi:hypothetical protein
MINKDSIMKSGLKRVHFSFIEVTTCKKCGARHKDIVDTLRMPICEGTVELGLNRVQDNDVSVSYTSTTAKVSVVIDNKIYLCDTCQKKINKIVGGR